jgi:uncharacterized membrane protein
LVHGQSSLNLQRIRNGRVAPGWPLVFGAVWLVLAIVFVALPWPAGTKALAVLHGLCAQQPTHSFYFGDQRLPFDARMTGIYGGFATASLVLLVAGRWRAGAFPPRGVVLSLVFGVVALAVDGANSTLVDARLWHVYTPRNDLRLLTGLLVGTALAVFVWLLIGQVGFARAGRRHGSPLTGWRDLGVVLLAQWLFALLVLSRWRPLWLPITVILMAAAILALTGLMLAFVLLLGRRENRAIVTSDLAGPGTIALFLALVMIGSLAAGRFLLEIWLGLPVQG